MRADLAKCRVSGQDRPEVVPLPCHTRKKLTLRRKVIARAFLLCTARIIETPRAVLASKGLASVSLVGLIIFPELDKPLCVGAQVKRTRNFHRIASEPFRLGLTKHVYCPVPGTSDSIIF